MSSFGEMAFRNNALFIKGNYYWADLKRFFDRFQRDRIRIVLFDDLIADAGAVAPGPTGSIKPKDGTGHIPSESVVTLARSTHPSDGAIPGSELAFSIIMLGRKHLERLRQADGGAGSNVEQGKEGVAAQGPDGSLGPRKDSGGLPETTFCVRRTSSGATYRRGLRECFGEVVDARCRRRWILVD